jgi:hypothetical protein
MSNAIFPVLPGLQWERKRTPKFSTIVQTSVSGKESRVALWSYPRYTYSVSYDILRSSLSFLELQTLMGFFNQRQGMFDSFLFDDPEDDTATAQLFGTGDGTTTAFQLSRTYGGWNDPITNLNGAPQIFLADWQGNSLIYPLPRNNQILYSEQLTNAAWGYAQCTPTANAGTSPRGDNTATLITAQASPTNTFWQQANLTTNMQSMPLVFSTFLKFGSYTGPYELWLRDGAGTTWAQAMFNLQSQTVSGVTSGAFAGIIPYSNGWFRIWLAITFPSNAALGWLAIVDPSNAPAGGETYYNWGSQLEADYVTFPTRYIVTTSAPVGVTDYSLSASGVVTVTPAPLLNASLTWTGMYYWLCRFLADEAEFQNDMYKWWSLKKLEWITIKGSAYGGSGSGYGTGGYGV